ncbi:CCA tRNA nucleotidyltransferase [Alienimonas californiensis]|uniref:tRNA nucleotidyltransferase/poly(A) polymerase n=1 Tax=Alienimonas californiensis TaxID=2527989 RepID=A0A517PER1_9PLAN|nr:CCA tRNA nucleotidyltransferase [Alienimonas californiensis]QDT17858.1 tRNA nucleotidyltransferase/poly(A) polymerase [Alienimonas californiensis]
MTDRPADPNRDFAVHVAGELSRAGHVALFAGGCVRDRLLGKAPKDYDVATDAPPAAVRKLFGRRRTLAVGESFGVIVVLPDRQRFPGAQQVEVATFREETGYADGRRPDAVRFSTPEADAQRRDFTINGLFENPATGGVIDYVAGAADLKAGVLRAIGDPAERMREDKLRLLRAVRFAATLKFTLDPSTADAVRSEADGLPSVSGERIGAEMRRILADPQRAAGVRLLEEVALLGPVAPAVDALPAERRERTVAVLDALGAEPVPFPLGLAALLIEVGSVRKTAAAWRLSNDEAQRAGDLLADATALDGFDALPPHRKKRLLARDHAADLIALTAALRRADGRPTVDADAAAAYLAAHAREELAPAPLLTGADLIAAGMRPGPEFKALLDRAYDAQLDGRVRTTEDALAFVL